MVGEIAVSASLMETRCSVLPVVRKSGRVSQRLVNSVVVYRTCGWQHNESMAQVCSCFFAEQADERVDVSAHFCSQEAFTQLCTGLSTVAQ